MDEHDKPDLRAIGARLRTDFSLPQLALPSDMGALLERLRIKEMETAK